MVNLNLLKVEAALLVPGKVLQESQFYQKELRFHPEDFQLMQITKNNYCSSTPKLVKL